jgi:spermidine/putrescine transport system ATP-binding protein
VTHDQEEAMSMADTIAVMNRGQIEQAGSATDLYERPTTAFVAKFLGISNLIDAEVGAGDGTMSKVTTHDGAALHAPTSRCAEHAGTPVRVGVRPEKVRLHKAGEATPPSANVLRGRVLLSSFLGVSLQYVIEAAGGEELTVYCQNDEGVAPDAFGAGQEVQLSWDPRHTIVVARGDDGE